MSIKPSPWIPHVEAFVSSSSSTRLNDDVDAIASMVKDGRLTLLALVRDMELYLTATDHFLRGRGVKLLGEVVSRLSSRSLDSATLHTLVEFFTARLADWQALHGALVGCLTLLRRKPDVGMVVGSDAKALAESFLQNIQVQLLALNDRKLCFEILVCLLDIYREDVSPLDRSLVDGICEAIDNEKDPSCLLLTFCIVELLVQLFPDPYGPVASIAEDLFDILSCYFPIHFTNPSNDHSDIKRDDISMALMRAFCSTPLFEPFAIPLLLDKLSSSLPSAKIDSLKYLRSCILYYGSERMNGHYKSIWYALKAVIFTSSRQESSPQVSEVDRVDSLQESQILKEALLCLEMSLSQHNDKRSFMNCIIEDKDFDICFSNVSSMTNYRSLSVENRQLLFGIGSILGVCSKVSSQCCSKVFHAFFSRLVDVLGVSTCNTSFGHVNPEKISQRRFNNGALYLIVELLSSCREVAASLKFPMESEPGDVNWFELLYSVHAPLSHVFGLLLTHGASEENILMSDISFGVKGLQLLATFPQQLQMSEMVHEHILVNLMSIITARSNDSGLWKMVLNSLVQIGLFTESINHSERRQVFMTTVVEKIISLLQFSDFDMPLSLKLEAAFAICAIGPTYMSRLTQELEVLISINFVEAFARGTQNSATTLVCSLQCYSRQVLSWYDQAGNSEEVAIHFALFIWDKIENICILNNNIYVQEACDELMITMKTAVGTCKEENQLKILHKAYDTFQSRIISSIMKSEAFSSGMPQIMQRVWDSVTLSCSEELLISLFAAVLIPLRPQIVIPDINSVIYWLMIFLLKGSISAAQALGSIINKWPTKVEKAAVATCTLEEALDIIFARELISSNLLPTPSVDVIVGFSWMGKGLLMRGHEKVKEITMFLFKCMISADSGSPNHDAEGCNEEARSHLLARFAADAFHILLCDSEACLNANFHAIVRPLYKQRFFSSVIPILLTSLKESSSSNTRSVLYQALGHVISNTPQAALIIEMKKLVLPLLECLSVLSGDLKNKDLLYSVLLVLSGILTDENGKGIIIENAQIIISFLLKLTSYPHMMLVREMAVQCLQAMSLLPYARIYPMRQQVLRNMLKALDDPKRRVRLEATRCQRTWGLLA